MDIKQLEYFLAAAESKSMSKAAKRLHVSQPPVSRQIAMLEDELGVCLFQRTNKGIELTEAGRTLFRQGTALLHDIKRITDSVRDADAGLQGQLRIGTIYSDVPILMEKLHYLRANYPQIEIYIRHGTPGDLMEELREGKLHVLFLRTPSSDLPNFHTLVLGEDPLALVMHRDLDPAPGQSEIPIDLLRDVPMCMLRDNDFWGYNDYLVKECQRHGFTPNIVCQCYDTPMTMLMVLAGFGLSYQPRSIVDTLNHPDVYAKQIQGILTRSFPVLVWDDTAYLSGCAKLFLSLFRNESTEAR